MIIFSAITASVLTILLSMRQIKLCDNGQRYMYEITTGDEKLVLYSRVRRPAKAVLKTAIPLLDLKEYGEMCMRTVDRKGE